MPLARARIAWDHEHVRRLAFAIVLLTASVADAATISGVVVDAKTSELLVGVTVLASSDAGPSEQAAITDEHGVYTIDVPPGTYTITMFYGAATVITVRGLAVTGDVALGLSSIDSSQMSCCVDWWFDEHDPALSSDPRFGLATNRDFRLPTRDRTHRAWIAPVAAADPARVVTTVEGGARFAGAPGIPLAFVQEVATYTLRVPVPQPAGSGGASNVALRSGSNELQGEVRAVLDAHPGAVAGEAFAGGPIVRDKAWFGAGLVASRSEAHGLVDLNYAASSEHQGALQVLVQPHDAWANASWVSKFIDNKLELTGRATVERLELVPLNARLLAPAIVDRAGGTFGVAARKRFHGYHAFAFSAGGGAGERGDTHHADASVGIGDSWQILPNLEVLAGVRSDARTFGGERATVVSPRVAVNYDVTKEGRSDLFIAFQRTPLLDDSLPGDWRGLSSLYRDELAIGASYLRSAEHWPMFGVAARTRTSADATLVEHGVEGWMRYDTHRTLIHASATTLGRVATLAGRRTLLDRHHHKLYTSASARLTPDEREAAAAFAWRHAGDLFTSSDRNASVDVQVEGFAGTAGPGARLVLAAAW